MSFISAGDALVDAEEADPWLEVAKETSPKSCK